MSRTQPFNKNKNQVAKMSNSSTRRTPADNEFSHCQYSWIPWEMAPGSHKMQSKFLAAVKLLPPTQGDLPGPRHHQICLHIAIDLYRAEELAAAWAALAENLPA